MTIISKRMRRILARVQRDRKGAISILAAMSMTGVLGFAGLGTEVAYWYVKERDMQAAADSSAIAGAAAIMSGDTASQAAKTSAAQYGFIGGAAGCSATTTTVICINNPPRAGSHTGDGNAVEVVVSQTQNRLFSAFFMSSNPVFSTRAVATQIPKAGTAPSCVVTLDHASLLATDLTANGTAKVLMPQCNVFVDSCDTTTGAMSVSGNATYSANETFICGTLSQGGSSSFTDTSGTQQRTGTIYQDPYQNTTMPPYSGCNQTNMAPVNGGATKSGQVVLSPGVYCGGMTLNGGFIDLKPGTYVMNGVSSNSVGFQVNGNATVTCSQCDGAQQGVTIALTGSGSSSTTWASVQINGTATVNLSAPQSPPPGYSGTVAGDAPFLFYQDRNTPTGSLTSNFNGNANSNLSGSLYFPNQKVVWNGNSTVANTCTQVVAWQVQFNGTNNFSSNASDCANQGISSLTPPGGTAVSLVE